LERDAYFQAREAEGVPKKRNSLKLAENRRQTKAHGNEYWYRHREKGGSNNIPD
jgi:hypothetical protein